MRQQQADAGLAGRHDDTVDLTAEGSCRDDPEVGAGGGGGVSVTRTKVAAENASQGDGGVGTSGIEVAKFRHASVASDGDKETINRIHVKSGIEADRVADRGVSGTPEISGKQTTTDRKDVASNHWTGVAVCVTGAVMSSMLQFAFVYGERGVVNRLPDNALMKSRPCRRRETGAGVTSHSLRLYDRSIVTGEVGARCLHYLMRAASLLL